MRLLRKVDVNRASVNDGRFKTLQYAGKLAQVALTQGRHAYESASAQPFYRCFQRN